MPDSSHHPQVSHPDSLLLNITSPHQVLRQPQTHLLPHTIFYTSFLIRPPTGEKKNLHHSLLKISRPPCRLVPLSAPRTAPHLCCCRTNPWPLLFVLFHPGPLLSWQNKGGKQGGSGGREERGGRGKKHSGGRGSGVGWGGGQNVPSLYSGQARSNPRLGVEIPLQLPAFHYSLHIE